MDERTESHDVAPNGPTAPTPPAKRSRWLEGIYGTLRFLVQDTPVATLIVEDGEARIVKEDGPADTTVLCRSQDDVDGLLRGDLNLVVIALLGRLEVEGNVALGLQVLSSMHDAVA